MGGHRDGAPDRGDAAEVDLRQRDAGALGDLGQDLAPRIHDQGVAVALLETAVVVPAVLRRREDVALRLDRARAPAPPSAPCRSSR